MKTYLRSLQTLLCAAALISLPAFSGSALAQAKSKPIQAELANPEIDKGMMREIENAKALEAGKRPVNLDAPAAMLAPSVASNYVFTTATNASLNDMSTGTTQLLAPNLDDTASPLTNIGFEFFFQGTRFTQFGINDNGVLRLGAIAQTGTPYKPLAQAATPIITAYGADQRTHISGKVHFKVTGAAPTRVLTVEWLNNQANFNAGGTADLTYQVRLYETTGVIECVYGSMTMSAAGAASTDSRDPNIGFSSSSTAGTVGSVTAPQSGTPGPTFNGASATPVANLYTAGAITTLTSATNGSRRIFTFAPPTPTAPTGLNFTAVTGVSMTLNWADSPDELSYVVYRSTDGTNYSFDGVAAQNATNYSVSGLSVSTNYFWQVYAISEGALSSALAGSQATTAAGTVTSVQSGLWDDTATWGGPAPTASDNVTIANGHTVVINSSNALSVTVQNGGVLEFETAAARTLTVGQSVTIDTGGIFRTGATGTQTGHILSVGGNLTNNGILDFSTNGNTAGAGITFTGAASNTFGGTGATTNVRAITINKGTSSANILELNPDNFTVQGVNTNVAGYLTLTNGTFKISGTFTMANRTFTTATYVIPATGGIWLNNPNYTVSATASSTTTANNGLFRLSQGTYNIGIGAGDRIVGATGAVNTIEGGTLNVSGAFAPQGNVTYTQSGGIVNCGTIGNSSSSFGTFELLGTASTFTISNGTINLHNPSTGATKVDYRNNAATATTNITGGSVVIGATAGGIYNVSGQMPSTSIASGRTMRVNNATVLMRGTTVTNNGVIDFTGANARYDFGSLTSAMTYGGSGVFGTNGTPVAGVGISSNSNFLVTLNAPIICNRVNLFVGGFTNSNQITLGNAGTSTTVVQIGSTGLTSAGGSFDVSPVHNQGSGGQILLYAFETTPRSTGVEVNPTRILTSINNVDNPNGVTIVGGDLTCTSTGVAAILTSGRLITGSNTLIFTSGAATVTRTTGYVDGNFRKTYSANATKTFEVGTANGFSPVAVQSTAGTYPTTFTAKALEGQAPYASGVNSLQRYWALTNGTIGTANLTFTYLPTDVVGAVASYQFLKNSGGTITILPPTGTPTSTSAVINGVTSFSDWTLGIPSANADLSNLVPSAGSLSPSFDPATIAYTDAVSFATTSITVTPTKADANASITVNGNPVASGSPSDPISLSIGSNIITTVVTAQDSSTKTYTIDVTRPAASTNADLSNLTLSAGTLTPAFASGTTSYTANVPNATSSMTVTPTSADANATITVNGNPVVSGSPSGAISLAVGPNVITTVVTAEDGTTTNTYTVTVTRAVALSSNADLSDLVPSVGTLAPPFASGTFAYTESVSTATTSMTVTPTAADATATIEVRINGGAFAPVASGSPSGALALNVGANTIDTRVTAQDTTTIQTYTITVTRSGNVNVNPGAGTYATLKGAFDAINAGTHAGAVTVDIVGDTTETAPAVLNASGAGSASYSTVMITSTGARTVSGAIAAGSPLVDLNGADNVTIDGLNVIGNSLTLSNTTSSATASTSTIRFIGGATNNIVRNCSILGSSTAAAATAGGNVFFSTSTVAGGNSNNTISGNNIGPAGVNLPSKGVMGLGTTGANANVANVIDNNNIFDFFNAANAPAGVSIQAANNNWTVSNNRLFQTGPRTFTGAAGIRYSGILVASSGNTHVVTGNVIGFGAADGTGTTTITGTGTGLGNEIRGIVFTNSSTTSFSSIQGNIISGINQTTNRNNTASTDLGAFVGIQSGSSATDSPANIGNITGNTIGSLDGSSTIVITDASTTANTIPIMGILDFNFVTGVNVSNNAIGSITIQGAGTTVGFRGILVGSTAGVTHTVSNNTVAAITNNLVGNNAIYGIQVGSANGVITGNTVRNLTANGNGAVVTMSGIIMSGSTGVSTVARNTVHSLLNNVTGGAAGAVYAIDCGLPVTANIVERNLVHSINVNSTLTAYQIVGIIARTQGTATYRNNMIRLGLDAAGNSITTGFFIVGLRDAAGTTTANSFYYNSVYIGGAGVVSVSNTYAMFSDVVTNARNYMDNIFWNARSNASGGIANVAIRLGGTTVNPAGAASNYNVLRASGTDGFTGIFNGGTLLTLGDWQTATGLDANSISADPLFVNPTGTAATGDLHLLCGSPALDAGISIVGVTNDFDGDTRPATPDIGADELTLVAPTPVSAVSRKVHGAAGPFNVVLPGIEPRTGAVAGEHQIVVTFASPVTIGSASITAGTGVVGGVTGNGTSTITVDLTGVANAQYLTLKLGCADDGVNLGDVSVTMGVLLGDVNEDGSVNAVDVGLVKVVSGLSVDVTNFRSDVSTDGFLDAVDIGMVKSQSGAGLP